MTESAAETRRREGNGQEQLGEEFDLKAAPGSGAGLFFSV